MGFNLVPSPPAKRIPFFSFCLNNILDNQINSNINQDKKIL